MAKQNLNGPLKSAKLADQKIMRGLCGKTHQLAGGDVPVLTTQQGTPVSDDQRGPPLPGEDLPFRS
jgi:catalase